AAGAVKSRHWRHDDPRAVGHVMQAEAQLVPARPGTQHPPIGFLRPDLRQIVDAAMRAADAVDKSDMHLVHRVLEALQPVARHELRLVLDEPLGLRRRIGRKGRRRALTEIGKDETEMFPRRIAAHPHLAGNARLLRRLLDALPAVLEFPAVIDAADVPAFDPAQMHLRAAMRAAVIYDLRLRGLSPVERDILAQDAVGFGMSFRRSLAV